MKTRVSGVQCCWCLLLAAALLVGSAGTAVAGPLTLAAPKAVAATSGNETPHDIDGSQLVWTIGSPDLEIVCSDVSRSPVTHLQITDNATDDDDPRIADNVVVWVGTDGDLEIFARDLADSINHQVTSNTGDDEFPDTDDRWITWAGRQVPADDPDPFLLNGSEIDPEPFQLADNDLVDALVTIANRRIAWVTTGEGFGYRLNCLDMTTNLMTEVGAGSGLPGGLALSDKTLAWATARSPIGTFVHVKPLGGLTRTFSHPGDDGAGAVFVADPLVTWWSVRIDEAHPGTMYADLWVYDMSKSLPPMRLINDAPDLTRQALTSNYLFYARTDAGQSELWCWDRATRTSSKLTSTPGIAENDAVASGNRVVWARNNGSDDDIYTATLVKSTPSISLSAPTLVSYAASTKLSGSLKSGATALAGRKVAIDYSYNGTSWKAWKTVTTNSAGAFVAYPKPTRKTYYRAVFAGDAAFSGKRSATRQVLVRAYLTRPSGPKSIEHGVVFTSTGYLKPRHTAGTKPVRIQCYRKESGSYRLKKTYYAKVSNYSSYSKYKASVNLPSAGSWRIRAYYPTTTTNYKKYSTYRDVTAK